MHSSLPVDNGEEDFQKILFNCGVHLGHDERTLNSRMKGFAHGSRHERVIFDLRKTTALLARSQRFINEVYKSQGKIFIYASRRDLANLLYPLIPRNPQITWVKKWTPGLITNQSLFHDIASKVTNGAWKDFGPPEFEKTQRSGKDLHEIMSALLVFHLNENYTEEFQKTVLKNYQPILEQLKWEKLLQVINDDTRIKLNLPSRLDVLEKPSCIISFHARDHGLALHEAYLNNIPVVGICDSDCETLNRIQYIIPGSDDGLKAQYLYSRVLLHDIPSVSI